MEQSNGMSPKTLITIASVLFIVFGILIIIGGILIGSALPMGGGGVIAILVILGLIYIILAALWIKFKKGGLGIALLVLSILGLIGSISSMGGEAGSVAGLIISIILVIAAVAGVWATYVYNKKGVTGARPVAAPNMPASDMSPTMTSENQNNPQM